jgi:hypothetical protein
VHIDDSADLPGRRHTYRKLVDHRPSGCFLQTLISDTSYSRPDLSGIVPIPLRRSGYLNMIECNIDESPEIY